ncbi:MAG: hypothetical protein M1824_001599 [Vezdaea acicularis]|nr:MAG: hypothetical protein M1824_001599 [Vezdaea acicularis]
MKKKSYADEFPLLANEGLYASHTEGNGNCLFNALSDQLYGNSKEHLRIRFQVVEYIRQHPAEFKPFLAVEVGGGTRRNPRRETARYREALSSAPSEADLDRAFEAHLAQMIKTGEWGDNMEITAFTKAFEVDVKIYIKDRAYLSLARDDGLQRATLHIAYHDWQHYSSVRRIAGPHSGPPEVDSSHISIQPRLQPQSTPLVLSPIEPWKIDVVSKSLPFPVEPAKIRQTLEECNGDVDDAVSKLLDEDRGSASSGSQASSRDRDADSDYDPYSEGPNTKKQDRRMSRATRALKKTDEEHNQHQYIGISTFPGFMKEEDDNLLISAIQAPLPSASASSEDLLASSSVPSDDNASVYSDISKTSAQTSANPLPLGNSLHVDGSNPRASPRPSVPPRNPKPLHKSNKLHDDHVRLHKKQERKIAKAKRQRVERMQAGKHSNLHSASTSTVDPSQITQGVQTILI